MQLKFSILTLVASLVMSASAAPVPAEGSELLVCATFHPIGWTKASSIGFLRHAYHLIVAIKENHAATLAFVG